jgi:4-amino-4-deoxy-L-arabinose transferase-like glycosyltransferase
VILLLSACTLGLRLGALPFVGADEPRYARIAEEMWKAGDWVTPTLEHRPWLEKPPLYYWLTIPAYRLFGIGEFAARFGSVLAAVLAAVSVFAFGAFAFSRVAGLAGALVLLTSIGFVAFARSASTDLPMTGLLTVAISALGAAMIRPVPSWLVYLGWAALGLAVLSKGPVALVIAAGVVILFWALDDRGGALRRCRVAGGLLISAAVSMPWFWLAFRENGFSFVLVFLINHNLARYVSEIHHHPGPLYYYFLVLPGLMFPWTIWLGLIVPPGFRARLRDWRHWDPATLFLCCWVAFPLVFFSASGSKLPGYVLPCMPPLALLIGRQAECWFAGGQNGAYRIVTWGSLVLSMIASISAAAVLAIRYDAPETGVLVAALAFVPALVSFRALRSGRPRHAFIATCTQGVTLVAALAFFAFPVVAPYHSARDIAIEAVRARAADEPIVSYRYFHHTLHYYTGYRIAEDLATPESLQAFAATHFRFLAVVPSTRLGELGGQGMEYRVLAVRGPLCVVRVSHPAGG